MVGVPGKSKGCLTCRERKVRCDLKRPACDRCQRTKRVCGGYARSIVFLNKSSRGFDLHSRGTSDIIHSVTEDFQDLIRAPVSPQHGLQERRGHSPISIPNPLDTTPLLHNVVLAEFVNSTLPKGATGGPPLTWITTILDSANCHETLSLAGLAIGHGWTGHIEAQFDRVAQGRQCYSRAISRLRKDLVTNPAACSDTMLTTASALVLYELIEFGTYDAQGWLAHASGIETIISQASARKFVAGSSHKVFLFCRVVIILRSLLHRRATFLIENEWRHIPWTLQPKNPFHQLLDVVTEVAALLEVCDAHSTGRTVKTRGHRAPQTPSHILVKTALLVSRLKSWYAESATRLPQGPFIPIDSKDKTVALKAPTEPSANRHWYPARQHPKIGVSFELLQQARLMLFYWAVVLTLQIEVFQDPLLRNELYQAHEFFDSAISNQGVEQDVRATISIDLGIECADSIVRWFEFAAQDVWNSFGPAFGVFSLKAAITWYSIYRGLFRSRISPQSDRSKQSQQAQSMLLRLVNHGSPPTYRF